MITTIKVANKNTIFLFFSTIILFSPIGCAFLAVLTTVDLLYYYTKAYSMPNPAKIAEMSDKYRGFTPRSLPLQRLVSSFWNQISYPPMGLVYPFTSCYHTSNDFMKKSSFCRNRITFHQSNWITLLLEPRRLSVSVRILKSALWSFYYKEVFIWRAF